MRDNSRILTWVFLFVGLASAAAVVIASLVINSRNETVPTVQSTLTQSTTQASSLPLPTPQESLVFDENFDDGFANGVATINAKWEIIDNDGRGRLFQVDNKAGEDWVGFSLGTTNITNGTIEYKEKLVDYDSSLGNGGGAVACHFRSNLQDRYLLALQADVNLISMNYQSDENLDGWRLLDNTVIPYVFEKSVWYDVRIEITGNQFIVYFDGTKILSATDDKLKNGEIYFGIAPNTIVQFDDITVTEFEQ